MKKILFLFLMLVALPVLAEETKIKAEETKIKAEQIRNNAGHVCFRCDYVIQKGWITKVVNDGEPWPLKAKEVLYILPLGLRPESILFQVYHVSPDYDASTDHAPATSDKK